MAQEFILNFSANIHSRATIDPPLKCYCRFGNFRENFIFANSITRLISGVENSRLRQDLPISINERVILPFRESFIFTKLRYAKFRENKVLAKISEFTVFLWRCDGRPKVAHFYMLTRVFKTCT